MMINFGRKTQIYVNPNQKKGFTHEIDRVDVTVYSNRDEHYVTVAELKALAKGKLQQVDPQRAEQIEQFVQAESHLNLPRLSRAQLKQVSQAFKRKLN